MKKDMDMAPMEPREALEVPFMEPPAPVWGATRPRAMDAEISSSSSSPRHLGWTGHAQDNMHAHAQRQYIGGTAAVRQ